MATEVENNVQTVTVEIKDKDETTPATTKAEEAAVTEKQEVTETPAPVKEPPPPKVVVHKSNYEKDVVYLYQFSRTPLLPSISSYCLKVESWLRLAGLKYENVDHKAKFRSKKGQLPFVELNGEEIPDSTIIIKDLSQRFDKDLDAGLTQEQRNVAHAMVSMIENHLLWVILWWRSKYPEQMLKGYKINIQHALGSRLPNSLLSFCFKFQFGRKWFQGAKKLKAQGMGVHSAEEVEQFGERDLKVLSDVLADRPFFFGDEPTSLDVVAFANLAQIYFIDKEVSYPLRDFMTEQCPNLVGHVSRMKERLFPDWDDMCSSLELNSHLPKPPPEEKDKDKEAAQDEKEGDKEKEPSDKDIEKDIEKEKADEKEKEIEKESEENKEKESK